MLLTMGVRDCPEQVEVYTNVFKCVKCMNDMIVVSYSVCGWLGGGIE